jgi:streptogramin lyase
VSRFDKTGAMLSISTGGGLNSPRALAVDDSGRVWVVNGNGTISSLRTDGSPASATAYANPELKSPISVSIDFKGSVWVANESSNSVTEVIGVAAPTVTPIVAAEMEPQL